MSKVKYFFRLRSFIVLLFALLLFGCQSAQKIGESWVGSTERQLFKSWGAPTRSATSGNDIVHTWERRNGYGRITCQQTLIVRKGKVIDHSSDCGYGFIK